MKSVWGKFFFCLVLPMLVASVIYADPSGGEPALRSPSAGDTLQEIGKLLLQEEHEEARAQAETLAESELARDRPLVEGAARAVLGLATWQLEEREQAFSSFDRATELFSKENDHFAAWAVLWMSGDLSLRAELEGMGIVRLEQALHQLQLLRAAPEGLTIQGTLQLVRAFGWDRRLEALLGSGPMLRLTAPFLATMLESVTRSSLGAAWISVGDLDRAERELERADLIAGSFGGIFDSFTEKQWGDLRRAQWRLEEAKEHYEKAWEGTSSFRLLPFATDSRQEIKALGKLAEIEFLAGNFEKALDWNEKASQMAVAEEDRSREAQVRNDRALLLMRMGRFEEAETVYLKALEIARSIEDHYRAGLVSLDLGQLSRMRGDWGQAVRWLEQSLDLLEEVDADPVESVAASELAHTYFSLGSSAAANISLERARRLSAQPRMELWNTYHHLVEVFGRVQNKELPLEEALLAWDALLAAPDGIASELSPEVVDFMRGLLRELFEGQLDGAFVGPEVEIETAALGRLSFLKAFPDIFKGLGALERGEFEEAGQVLRTSLGRTEVRSLREMETTLRLVLGVLSWKEGNTQQAIEWLRQSVEGQEELLAGLDNGNLISSAIGVQRRVADDLLVEFLISEGRSEEALIAAERVRARGLRELLTGRPIRRNSKNERLIREAEGLRAMLDHWERERPTASSSRRREIDRDLEKARASFEGLMVRLQVSEPGYVALVGSGSPSLDEIQEALGEGRAAIIYYLTHAGSHAWVVDHSKIRHVRLESTASEIGQSVVALVESLSRPPASSPRPSVSQPNHPSPLPRAVVAVPLRLDPPDGRDLYRALIAPLEPHLSGFEELIVVPHGPLHELPFAALVNPDTGRYLIEERSLLFQPSLATFLQLGHLETELTGGARVLGAPEELDPSLSELDYARDEVHRIAGLLGVEALLGPESRESRLVEAKDTVDLIHIAAHGEVNPRNPAFSRLALAPGEGEDGYLEVHEILTRLNLRGVNLVVLSACESSLGSRNEGDDVISLARAFLYAGSPGVVSTLWKVDDQASARLMSVFYDSLLSGDSVAKALRVAQQALLNDPSSTQGQDFRDPYYWAAFKLTGDPKARWGREAHDSPPTLLHQR
ncbi:MAG: CHAT domain-containing tetratricopeptide repeat protein [Acidobacteriota bacterium]|nr:CHAT domain-containing tetratricopeptide repeat protein [Acidobacteriota bacterium]